MTEQNEKTCGDCKHFRQHYIKFEKTYREIQHGHCMLPRRKAREKFKDACAEFEQQNKTGNS